MFQKTEKLKYTEVRPILISFFFKPEKVLTMAQIVEKKNSSITEMN